MTSCAWLRDEIEERAVFNTQCGNAFEFIAGNPRDNQFAFCPYCGKPIATPKIKPVVGVTYACGCQASGDLVSPHCPLHGDRIIAERE